jgi:hypothetical protein
VADVEHFQFKCGNGNHRARRRLAPFVLLILFFLATAAEASALIYGSLIG